MWRPGIKPITRCGKRATRVDTVEEVSEVLVVKAPADDRCRNCFAGSSRAVEQGPPANEQEAFEQTLIWHQRDGANSCRACGDLGIDWLGRLFATHQWQQFLAVREQVAE